MQMDSKRSSESDNAAEQERAVSDIVAFSLTFAIIITGVGLVSGFALDPITDFSEQQDVVNSERGFQSAATTIDELHRGGGTYEQFDLVPGNGDLFLAKQQEASSPNPFIDDKAGILFRSNDGSLNDKLDTLNQSIGNSELITDPALTSDLLTINTSSLVNYFGEDSYVGYQAGAVFRSDAAGLSYEPPIQFRETAGGDVEAYISVVNLIPGDNVQVASSFENNVAIGPTQVPEGTPVTASNRFASFEAERTGVSQVTADVDPANEFSMASIDAREIGSESWQQYFEELAEPFASSQLFVPPSSPVAQAGITCRQCTSVTLRIVDIRVSQLE